MECSELSLKRTFFSSRKNVSGESILNGHVERLRRDFRNRKGGFHVVQGPLREKCLQLTLKRKYKNLPLTKIRGQFDQKKLLEHY